jgi:hypothetical protein
MPRERMRDLELPAYMRALAEARRQWMEESSDRLDEHIEHLEWIDELAVALGICVDAEDWWDSTVPAKRMKIMGRISVLRSLRPAQETVPAPEESIQKAFAQSPRRISPIERGTPRHGDNCPCWDCTRDQFGI